MYSFFANIEVYKQLILKLIKFGAVGFTGMLVDFGITFLLKEKVKVHKYTANAVGFTVAASCNYFLNRIWTFQSNNPHVLKEFTHFFIVAVLGLAINSLVLWILVSKYKQHFYFSKLIAIIITMFWNFGANIIFTFNT